MRIALAGNPNSGKTTMYNALTGRSEKVGNWAGVTVEKKESNIKKNYYDTKEEVQRAYEVMKEGSTTIYKMEATPYSSCRVVFVDKFGIRWGIMTEQTER